MVTMNKYGAMAQKHWQRWLPFRYAQLPDPKAFFTALGERASEQIAMVEESLLRDATAPEEFIERAGQRNMARLQAEEVVLRDMILLVPEGTMEDEEPLPEQWRVPSATETVSDTEEQD